MSVRLGPYLNSVPEENKITLLQVIQSLSLVQDFLRTVWLVCTYGYHGQKLKFYSPKHFCKFEWNFTHFALSRNLLENFHISDFRSDSDFYSLLELYVLRLTFVNGDIVSSSHEL